MNTELDKKSSIETLIRCIVVGQSKGAFNIKDASLLYKIIMYLRGEENKDFTEKSALEALIKGVIISNSKGCYSLEEAALIDKIIVYLEQNKFISVETPVKEENKEEKVVEI